MTLSKSSIINKQTLSMRERIGVRIFTTETVLTSSTISSLVCMLLFCVSTSEAVAQAPYLNSKIAPVTTGNYTIVSVFCNEGDGLISGGYSLGFSSTQSAPDTMVYSNRPTQEINQTGYFEGWEAGLVNNGNAAAEIAATVLCLNLTLTP
jgi:hypothetical protein